MREEARRLARRQRVVRQVREKRAAYSVEQERAFREAVEHIRAAVRDIPPEQLQAEIAEAIAAVRAEKK